ncbi:MAG: hypothetical protein U0835_20870 [Isosphaeraceae bacterium]
MPTRAARPARGRKTNACAAPVATAGRRATPEGHMTVGEPRIIPESPVEGVSPWLLLMRDELRSPAEPLLRSEREGASFEVRHGGGSLWVVARWPSGARVAFCAAFAPAGSSRVKESEIDDASLEARLDTPFGGYRVKVELPSRRRTVLHWRTSLTPSTDLAMPFWPRDVLPLDGEGDPLGARGILHAAQHGPKGGLLFASLTRPEPGSFLYVQNLTALNDYFEKTHTSPTERVGGRWPELGFSLPTSADRPLAAHSEVVVSDAYVLPSPACPDDDLSAARLFLELYAEVYLALPRPDPNHRNWPRRIDETIQDLTHSPECSVEKQGRRYLLAYVGADDRPPESMVQLAVLVPLIEHTRARGGEVPLVELLKANLPTFFDPKAETVVRWLPGEERLLESQEEHMAPNVVDSWYAWHTCLNLARLAAFGDEQARDLFLRSIEYGIRVAQHFDYRWPVFYDLYTLETIKGESSPGRWGEPDVGAQYAHVMLEAWEMTGERRYFEEAERAARALLGLGFRLGYQFNNTSFGAGALLRLYQETGDETYLGLSHVCLANIVRNFWLWDCRYGNAKHYGTFMGLPPLQDAVYLAIYEELEVLAAFHEYLRIAGDDVLPALRILMPEYCKYLVDRAWYHYPSELPADVLAEKSTSGHLNRRLSIPLEDLSEGWTKAGRVGQEVYGSAAPFVFGTRHIHKVPGESFSIHCNYPAGGLEFEKTDRGGRAGFRILGDARCECQVWVVAEAYSPLPDVTLSARSKGKHGKRVGRLTEAGCVEFDVPGDSRVSLTWTQGGAGPDPTFPAGVRKESDREIEADPAGAGDRKPPSRRGTGKRSSQKKQA